jgi:hypothetical protein
MKNVGISGDPAAIRSDMPESISDMLEDGNKPGQVFDLKGRIEQVTKSCCAMNDHQAIKMLIEY